MAFLNYFLEVYYGENDNIKQMQKCISKFREDLMYNSVLSKLNTHPEIRKFCKLVEDEFGFKSFQLHISAEKEINVYSLPIYLNFKSITDDDNTMANLQVTKKGYKFKKEAKYTAYVCIARGILVDKRFTDREIMAIILHEIGHNFQAAISDYQSGLAQVETILYIVKIIFELMTKQHIFKSIKKLLLTPIMLTNAYRQILKVIDDILYDNFENFYHFVQSFQASLSAIKYPFSKFFKYMGSVAAYTTIPAYLLIRINPISLILLYSMGSFRGEKIADNFATIYGYGPDIASASVKLDTDELIGRLKVPLASPIAGLIDNTFRLLITLPSEHPVAITRIKDQSDYLKKELEKEDFDPKFKKEVMDQIKNIDKQVDELTSLKYKKALSDYNYSVHFYQLMLYKIFGGDPLDIFYKWTKDDIHQDIEDVYGRKLEESSEIIKSLNKIKLI